jgi:hypothetical protein
MNNQQAASMLLAQQPGRLPFNAAKHATSVRDSTLAAGQLRRSSCKVCCAAAPGGCCNACKLARASLPETSTAYMIKPCHANASHSSAACMAEQHTATGRPCHSVVS